MFRTVETTADGVVPIAAACTASTTISARGLPSDRLVDADTTPSNDCMTVLTSLAVDSSALRLLPVRLIVTPRLPNDMLLRSETSTLALSIPLVCSRIRVINSPVSIDRSSLRVTVRLEEPPPPRIE